MDPAPAAISGTPAPTSLKGDQEALQITWNTGEMQRIPWRTLRQQCPCALCRVQRTQPPQPAPLLAVITPEEARPVRGTGMRPLGNYAYHIDFSDGHNAGIFSLDLLYALGQSGQ